MGMFYGPSYEENYRRAAALADKILRGARPSELPVDQIRAGYQSQKPPRRSASRGLAFGRFRDICGPGAPPALARHARRGLLEPVGRKP